MADLPYGKYYRSRLIFVYPKLILKWILRLIFMPLYILAFVGAGISVFSVWSTQWIENINIKKWDWY